MSIAEKLRKRGLSLPACILLLALVGSGVSAYWSMNTLKVVSAERDVLSSDLSLLTQLQTTILHGEDVLDQLENSLTTTNYIVPKSMDFRSFYGELTSITRKHDIDISKIEPREAQQVQDYRVMTIILNAESSFGDFFKFTRDLSATQRLVTLERMDVRGVHDGDRCVFEISMNIYARGDEGEGNG